MPKPRKMRVLVAEMSAIRRMIAAALKRAGFAVECCDPKQARALLRDKRFCVLITNSPAHLHRDQVATIYLAADSFEFADSFPPQVRVITKPFEVEHLVANVRELLMINAAPQRKPANVEQSGETAKFKAGGQ